jgi:hypothetical protein
MAQRTRQRDNAGVSEASWKKHRLLWRAASGQAHAYRCTHPSARCLIIDMHAADGVGVPMPQLDLFRQPEAWPTPLIAWRLAAALGNTDVVLCEQVRKKRQALAQHFPGAVIVKSHAEILSAVCPAHRWALVLNDPCGPADHGIETLQQLTGMLRLDTLIAVNYAALRRIMGLKPAGETCDSPFVASVRASQQKYAWMVDARNWQDALAARQMAQSVLIKASANFHYRIFVLSHTLSHAIRPPLWERVP